MTGSLHSLLEWTDDTSAETIAAADALICSAAPPPEPGCRIILVPADESESTLCEVVRLRPFALALMDCRSGADVQRLDVLLSVAEAVKGVEPGTTRILAWTDGLLPAPFDEAGFHGKSARLCGLVWDWRPLARLLGASRCRDDHGCWTPTFAGARAATLMSAKAAGVSAYEVVEGGSELSADCRHARADGFDGRVATDAGQIAIINRAFSPL
ncbi:hypothetical protein OCK02_15005 [Rhizobium sp. TRM96647]|uniref:hypothetical protein n=1 Tax=unclassified Rhizobium TaxID=2613769 RepID=UPI0021E7D9FE|nr:MULTISPECIES: hypothetical protein [unclassified Rhizobium]MCV3737523.1 hypothetical protein [Rhizobium sp. TRM96647]MCV3756387.1 hypothetical protein [Rhizobium sp. TRM96650]